MVKASEIRARARATLGGNIFKPQWLLALVVCVIVMFASAVTSYVMLASFILMGPIYMGQSSYFLNIKRREGANDDFSTLLDGFKVGIGRNIATGLLVTLYTFLWSLLLIIPGIVKAYAYSMTYYIRLDHPEYTVSQAIKASEEMMKGHKMDLFVLHLSFIGWMIVGTFCCGIGMLWVYPYMKAAVAHFYEEIKPVHPTALPEV